MKLLFAFALAMVLAGCSPSTPEPQSGTGSPTATNTTPPETSTTPPPTPASAPQTLPPPPKASPVPKNPEPVEKRQPKAGDEVAVMETSLGRIVLMFFPDKAPQHVVNFKYLAGKGFYDGTKFHRIIPDFMIQGGDPNTKTSDVNSWGMGGPGYNVNAEFNDVHHAPGILSMARTGDPNGAGSQFFIMVADKSYLDHQYTAFGKVVSGMDVVEKIKSVPTGENDRPNDPPVIKSLKIVKWPVQ